MVDIVKSAEVFVKDRPTSLNDDLYEWAIDAEYHIDALCAEINLLRGRLKHAEYLVEVANKQLRPNI